MRAAEMNGVGQRRDFSLIQNQHGADRDFVVGRMRGAGGS